MHLFCITFGLLLDKTLTSCNHMYLLVLLVSACAMKQCQWWRFSYFLLGILQQYQYRAYQVLSV